MKSWGKNFKKEQFECQTNGIISNSIVQNWTPAAIDCYKIHSNCAICPIKSGNYSFKCKMSEIVDLLLQTRGIPDEQAILQNTAEEDDIIVA